MHIVPKSDGLPARLNALWYSARFCKAARGRARRTGRVAFCWPLPATKGHHPLIFLDPTRLIVARVPPILRAAGRRADRGRKSTRKPRPPCLPAKLNAGMEPELAPFGRPRCRPLAAKLIWRPVVRPARCMADPRQQLGLDLRYEAGKEGGENRPARSCALKQYAKGDLPAGFPAVWAPPRRSPWQPVQPCVVKSRPPALPCPAEQTELRQKVFFSAVGLELDEKRLLVQKRNLPQNGLERTRSGMGNGPCLGRLRKPASKAGQPRHYDRPLPALLGCTIHCPNRPCAAPLRKKHQLPRPGKASPGAGCCLS